jgi:CDP-diacylglycerol--serine O-phosphatidyltransferase
MAALALPMVLVPAFLMISTIRYRSFKTIDLRSPRSYRKLILLAVVMAAVATEPQWTLAVLAYLYLLSAFVELAVARFRRHGSIPHAPAAPAAADPAAPAGDPPQTPL